LSRHYATGSEMLCVVCCVCCYQILEGVVRITLEQLQEDKTEWPTSKTDRNRRLQVAIILFTVAGFCGIRLDDTVGYPGETFDAHTR
jgi:hypothetical protein